MSRSSRIQSKLLFHRESDVNEDCIDKRFERSCKDTRNKTTEEESQNDFSLGVWELNENVRVQGRNSGKTGVEIGEESEHVTYSQSGKMEEEVWGLKNFGLCNAAVAELVVR